jgi:hypothetical protein
MLVLGVGRGLGLPGDERQPPRGTLRRGRGRRGAQPVEGRLHVLVGLVERVPRPAAREALP